MTISSPHVTHSQAIDRPVALTPMPQVDSWWTQRHQDNLQKRKQERFDLVLVGDSITQRWETHSGNAYQKLLSQFSILNLGYAGDRTQHLLWRIEHGELDGIYAHKLILLIGTNNLPSGRSTPEETITAIQTIVSILRNKLPDTRMLLLGILPRGLVQADPLMDAVRQVNLGIQQIASSNQCEYADFSAHFIDASHGATRTDLLPDHLHPNEQGYAVLYEQLQPFLND